MERVRLIRDEVKILAVPRLMEEVATEGGGNIVTKRAKWKICIEIWQQLPCCLHSSAKRVHKFFNLFSEDPFIVNIDFARFSLPNRNGGKPGYGSPYFVISHHSSGARSFSKGVAFSIALKFNNGTNIWSIFKIFFWKLFRKAQVLRRQNFLKGDIYTLSIAQPNAWHQHPMWHQTM